MRASLCDFLDRSRITATLAEQPQRTSLAGSALSDASSGDCAIDATFSHFDVANHGDAHLDNAAQQGQEPQKGNEVGADGMDEGERGAEAASEQQDVEEIPPDMPAVTELARVPPGQEHNPVFKWHNEFVATRYKGRQHLQVFAAASVCNVQCCDFHFRHGLSRACTACTLRPSTFSTCWLCFLLHHLVAHIHAPLLADTPVLHPAGAALAAHARPHRCPHLCKPRRWHVHCSHGRPGPPRQHHARLRAQAGTPTRSLYTCGCVRRAADGRCAVQARGCSAAARGCAAARALLQPTGALLGRRRMSACTMHGVHFVRVLRGHSHSYAALVCRTRASLLCTKVLHTDNALVGLHSACQVSDTLHCALDSTNENCCTPPQVLLVEAQKASDPLSLITVEIVKDLLEAGHTLHSPLFNALVSRFSAFVHSTGMLRYNYFLLPIFTFVRKCCGLPQADMDAALERHRLAGLVYAPPDAPARPVTPLTPLSRPSTVQRPVRVGAFMFAILTVVQAWRRRCWTASLVSHALPRSLSSGIMCKCLCSHWRAHRRPHGDQPFARHAGHWRQQALKAWLAWLFPDRHGCLAAPQQAPTAATQAWFTEPSGCNLSEQHEQSSNKRHW